MAEHIFRYAGEFEPQQAVILCWPRISTPVKGMHTLSVFAEIIKNLVDEGEVYVNCGYPGTLDSCRQTLREANVDLDKVHITQYPDNMSWARDYGPDMLTDDAGGKRLVSFRFNMYGEGAEDGPSSVLCARFAPHMAIELGCKDFINAKLISEGGDKEFNGAGVMIALEHTEVDKRNPDFTREAVEEEFKRVFNLKKIIWLPDGVYDDESATLDVLDMTQDGRPVYRSGSANGHIDEMCRFVDEHTVLLAEVTEEEAAELKSARISKERLDKAYGILKEATAADGKPLRILRMPIPEPIYIETTGDDWSNQTWGNRFADNGDVNLLGDGTPMPCGDMLMQPAMSYCNFLIFNGVVLAQTYWEEGRSEAVRKKDEAAMKVLQEAFPGRRIVPILATDLNIRGGGIHCVTKNVSK